MNSQDYNRKYYLANKHRAAAYREATKDRRNARRRELYRTSDAHRVDAIRQAADYRSRNPMQRAAGAYGIDPDRLELLKDRGCSICGCGWAPGVDIQMHADHDHATGRFRGVLCGSCNLGIGKFYDNPELLLAAASYLQSGAFL
jgi:hypothetical protein